jgi:dTDP-glucose 4,6-dehydratase
VDEGGCVKVVVTGGAGFLGSHLCRAFVADGHSVTAYDDLSTGRRENIVDLLGGKTFRYIEADVCDGLDWVEVDIVCHLASPASPPEYQQRPVECLRVNGEGTHQALLLAEQYEARFLLASSSEVYGDPEPAVQGEDYWGRVNPIGPRSCYDEGKRYAEALAAAFGRRGTSTVMARIFNTYGPNMQADDGRVVTNFLTAALTGEPLVVHGDGTQTRSLCFVDDTVRGLLELAYGRMSGPYNVGNPDERTVFELADLIQRRFGPRSPITFGERPVDDPARRCPEIKRLRAMTGWWPEVALEDGLDRTAEWLRTTLQP